MRFLPAIVVGYLTMVSGEPQADAPRLVAGLTRSAIAGIDVALGFGLAPDAPPFDQELDAPRRFVTTNGRVVSLLSGCRTVLKPYDLVVHFHGAPTAVEPAFERTGIDAVLAILNLGTGSGRYDTAFQPANALDDTIARVRAVAEELCPGASKTTRRVALSAWSAGYGAVFRVLDRPRDVARIDAVLLADGLHAGFEYGSERERRVRADQMSPFAGFVDEAVGKRKLFALTHSSIGTPYASTTETADFLLSQVGAERRPAGLPRYRPGMVASSRADAGDFHVVGFDGTNEAAHADHLLAIGDTLFPYLKARWSSPRAE
jgi:hypothetical protein